MKGTIRLGRIAGVVVRAHWSVLVIAALIAEILADSILPAAVPGSPSSDYWEVGIVVCLLFLASLLAHELSHAVVARRHGLVVNGITLWMLGGVTAIQGEAAEASTALRVAVVGPLVSLLCGGVSLGIGVGAAALGGSRLVTAGLVWLGVTNGVIAVFNLLPGAPLDGGRVLQAVLWRRSGDRYSATLTSSRAGRVFGLVLIVLGVTEVIAVGDLGGLWLAMIGWFVMQAATTEAAMATVEHDLAGVLAEDAMETDFASVAAWQTIASSADTVAAATCDYCVVVGVQGELQALLPVDVLLAAAKARGELRIRDLAARFPPVRSCAARDDLAAAIPKAGTLPIAVLSEGRVVGVVTRASLRRRLRRDQRTAARMG